MKISNYTTTKAIMDKYNFNLKKKFGQNFIVDENTLNRIIEVSNVTVQDDVVEIGPGIGALTQRLCDNAHSVIAFEIDDTLIPILNNELDYDNFTLVHQDFLKVDFSKYLDLNNSYKVVANLPYYITTPILFRLVESEYMFDKIYVMMQKEVGERICASPSTKDYNALSVILQYHYDVKTVLDISRNIFVPKPNVDSVIVSLIKKDGKIKDIEGFRTFVKACFTQKRKNLRNNVKDYEIEDILQDFGYTLQDRAEKISVEDFINIYLTMEARNESIG